MVSLTNHTWPNGPVQASISTSPRNTAQWYGHLPKDFESCLQKGSGKVHVLHGISMDTVDLLKRIMASQHEDQLPDHEQMEIGYFYKTNKISIKSCPDVNDVWGPIRKGEKVTL